MTIDPKELIDSRRFLAQIGFWPADRRVQLEQWLSNFDEEDTDFAIALLESHVHIGVDEATQAIESAIRGISTDRHFTASPFASQWQAFVDTSLVSFPVETPGDATASGYSFAAFAEDIGFRKNQIYAGDQLVHQLNAKERRPVIFVDDLSATGSQFVKYWNRNFHTPAGKCSLARLHAVSPLNMMYFCPVISTTAAKAEIESNTPVLVRPAYLLEPEYEVLHPDTRLVPSELRHHTTSWLSKYSPRAGWPHKLAGYGDLGLALSILNKSPNNTAPPLQWGPPKPDWEPTVK